MSYIIKNNITGIIDEKPIKTFKEYLSGQSDNFNTIPRDINTGSDVCDLHVLNLGSSECMIWEYTNTNGLRSFIIIDIGSNKRSIIDYFYNFLDFSSQSLRLIILTHPHFDHYGGLQTLIKSEKFKIPDVLISDIRIPFRRNSPYRNWMNKYCINNWNLKGKAFEDERIAPEPMFRTIHTEHITEEYKENRLKLPDNICFDLLSPTPDAKINMKESSNLKDITPIYEKSSIVTRFQYGKNVVLLGGDMQGSDKDPRNALGWKDILENYCSGDRKIGCQCNDDDMMKNNCLFTFKSTFFKVPNHGSIRSCPSYILSVIQPQYAIICSKASGGDKVYPNSLIIERLRKGKGIKAIQSNNWKEDWNGTDINLTEDLPTKTIITGDNPKIFSFIFRFHKSGLTEFFSVYKFNDNF